MTAATAVDRLASAPYRYLDYFLESDRLSFAGREDDIAEVAARASGDEPFVLYGRSGLGKTSLLLAGVFPLLRERRLRPVRVRAFAHPDVDLRNALATELGLDCDDTVHDLQQLVERLARTEGLVLAFDQFEEFFISTRSRPATRREFIHRLAAIVRHPGWDVRLAISLREDYLAELDEFRDEFPDILSNQYRLLPLTAFGARQAIVAPLVLANIPFDQQLVVRLVDLLAGVDFDPVLLQIACGEVYREAIRRQRDDVRLTEADLDRVGGIQGLFERYLDNAISRVPREMLLLSRAVLDALITPEETKRAITFEALAANDDFKVSVEELQAVLECLKQQKLVRGDLRTGSLWYELAHDRLGPSVVKWFKRDADFAQFRDARDLIAEAARRAAYPAKLETLIGRPQIERLINPFRERLRLTAEQRALMLWSAIYAQVDDVAFWAALAGPAVCDKALLALLEHPAADARLAAARASARLAGVTPPVVQACVSLALNDSDAGVRAAAAAVLVRDADESHLDQVASALRSCAQRSHALDVLATFVDAGASIDRFGRFSRILAKWHARRRVLAAQRDKISARGGRGVLVGFLASAAWMATIGLPMAIVAKWANGEIQWLSSAAYPIIVTGVVSAVVAIGGGWWLGRAGAKRAAIKGVEGRCGSVILRAPATLLAVGWLALLTPMPGGEGLWLTKIGFLATAAVLGTVLVLYPYLVRAVVWPPDRTGPAWRVFWAFLVGLPVALPIALTAGWLPAYAGLLWIAAGIASALPTIVVLVLSETAVAHPIGKFPPIAERSRVLGRGLLLASAAVAGLALWFTFGRDSVPLAAQTIDVSAGARIPIDLRSAVDSSYFRIETTAGSRWFVARAPAGVTVKGVNTRIVGTSVDAVMHLPPGQHLMSAISSARRAVSGNFELHAIRHLEPGDTIEPSTVKWTPFVLRLEELPADGEATRIWRAELPVVIRRGGPRPASATLWLRPLLAGAAFDVSAGALKERLITFAKPQLPGTFIMPEPPAKASAYYLGPDMQPFDIDDQGRARLLVTHRDAQTDPRRSPVQTHSATDTAASVIHLPIGLKLVESFDWQRDWDDAIVLEDAANEFLLSNRVDEGIELLKRVAELKPADYMAQNQYAWALVMAGRGAEAVDTARRAVELSNRKNASVLDTLAHARYDAGHWEEALKAWEEMLTVDPEYYKPLRDPFCEKDHTLIDEAQRRLRGTP
jgi:hypothetical protein